MAKKTVSAYQNPLDWFLDWSGDDETRLTIIARRSAEESFPDDTFKADLISKLGRLRYVPPHPGPRHGASKPIEAHRTFHDILEDAGVLELIFHRETLLNLWKCILIKKIVEHDREIAKEHRSVEGQPLSFYRKKLRQIGQDLKAIGKLGETYGAREEAEKLSEKVSCEYRQYVPAYLRSVKYTGSRAELLAGRPANPLLSDPRNEDSACQVHIFRLLKRKLQTARTRRNGISDIFLCQLSELIWAAPNVRELTDGDTLFRATLRFKG